MTGSENRAGIKYSHCFSVTLDDDLFFKLLKYCGQKYSKTVVCRQALKMFLDKDSTATNVLLQQVADYAISLKEKTI